MMKHIRRLAVAVVIAIVSLAAAGPARAAWEVGSTTEARTW